MSTEGGGRDPYEDLFADEDYDPSLAFAITAATQAAERAQAAEVVVKREVAAHGGLRNAIAASARKSVAIQLAALMSMSQQAGAAADEAKRTPVDSREHAALVSQALDTYDQSIRTHEELLVSLQLLSHPDTPMPVAPAVPLPTTQDAATVSTQANADGIAWVRGARTQVGKLCVMRNSPGVGKTETIIDIALDEQRNKRRVIIAARTKAMIMGDNPELLRRVESKAGFTTHLHVIYGRDETNCSNYDNVKAVQEHGLAPGRTVCLGCECHPRNAYALGLQVCDYYEVRIRAHNDSRGARIGVHATYPIILTPHAALIAAFHTGGGQFGAFWGCDTILIDEDPTDSLETTVTLTADQAEYSSPRPEDRATTVIARIYRRAIAIAEQERVDAQAVGFLIEGEPNPVHHRGGSCYAGAAFHQLMLRAAAVVAQTVNLDTIEATLRDVVEGSSFTTEPGRLYGLTSARQLNTVVPPTALSVVSDTLLEELRNITANRWHLYEKVRNHRPHADTAAEVQAELLTHTDIGDSSYSVRLEWVPGGKDGDWQFAAQVFAPLNNHVANIVVGDAYANVEHYEHLFDRTCDKLIDRVAHFPEGTRVVRLLTKSTITHLTRGYLQENLAILEAAIAAEGPGKRILLYGHLKLKDQVEQWMEGLVEKYQIIEWKYEHWWGGRGKDHYNGWDVYLQVSEPIQNIGGMLHTVNARAFRSALRSNTPEDRLRHTERIAFDLNDYPTFAHAMRAAHKGLFREHERQNINEQTQAVNRLRPVWNEVSCYIPGSDVELSRDLLAATTTIVPRDNRKENLSKGHRKGKRTEGALDAFLTPGEALAAMLSIVDWFGMWSGAFAHALVAVSLDWDPAQTGSERIGYVPFKLSSNWGHILLPPKDINQGPEGVLAPADSSSKICPAPPIQTLARRVWSPPVYWQRGNEVARRINAIKVAGAALAKALPSVRCDRWPGWRGRGPGGKPLVYYDPDLFGAASRPDLALAQYYAIMDRQYGPVVEGKLVAPDARYDIPTSWAEVPF